MAWTAPRTWVAGEVITAAMLNTHIRDNLTVLADGTWKSYTPTLTNITLGTGGTAVGSWVQIGKTVHFTILITFGTGGAPSGVPVATLPLPMAAAIGTAQVAFTDTGSNTYNGVGYYASLTSVSAYVPGTNGVFVGTSATVPFAFGSTDTIKYAGTYQAS
jgi:hypothetical protein